MDATVKVELTFIGEPMRLDFNPETLLYLEKGCRVIFAHLRGGSDLGPAWHAEARREKKHTTVKDLIAVCDALCSHDLTIPSMMVGIGKSAGAFIFGNLLFLLVSCSIE